ncbi:DNA damage-induced apoptosis suppressor protein [Tenrec ecaudatus]|uniref:DNA damage-induced apoptosis suppressor protein n=1 Tax=Tenrec ecaudatus TaxID=94439 RepID=UPI003F59385F
MNGKRKFLLASVLALQNSSFIYPSCQKCLSRITVVSKRSNCPKCGSTGEAGNTNYRYKLALKVTESNRLLSITVFGSCLDAFFGVTATGLHRYIEDPNKIPETLDSDTAQNLLTKAVETCFLGQSFIFGVTNFKNQHLDSRKFIPAHKRQVQALVASQIVLPDPSVAGFTVLDYFHQLLQPSNLRRLPHGTQANSCVPASGLSESALSSMCGSDRSSSFLEPCGRDACLKFWQPSLELTSSVSHLTDDEGFSASEQRTAIGLPQNRKCISFAEVPGSNGDQDALQHSRSRGSCVEKKNNAEKPGDELGLQANHGDAVYSNHHEIGVTDSNLFPMKMQELLEQSNTESPHSAVEIKNKHYQPELTAGHQHDDADIPWGLQESTACASPPRRREEIAGVSQDWGREVWDELPFSESLDKFLAVIESDITKTPINTSSRNYIDNGHDELRTGHIRLSVTPQRTAGALPSPPTALRSPQTTAKANSSEDSFRSKCEANPGPGVQKKSQPDHTETVSVSANRRESSDYFLPNAYLSVIFSSSIASETTIPKKTSISPKPSASESGLSFLNVKYTNGENSLAERREKLASLCSWKYAVSDLCNLEKKKYYRWPENEDDSLTICRQLIYPVEPACSSASPNTLKELPHGPFCNLTQSYSCHLGHSYNASADLFDVSAKEMEIATPITKRSPDIGSLWEQSLKESHRAESCFSLRSLSKSSSQSQKLATQNILAVASRTHSPPHFLSDSEYEFEDSQDFVPYSQSTPISRVHQTRIHEVKRAFERLPAFYSDMDANYKKRRISSEIDTQPGTPNGPKNKNTKLQISQTPVGQGTTLVCLHDSPAVAGCFEPGDSDWVPPTARKEFLSDKLRFCFEPGHSDWVPPTTRKEFLSDKLRFQSVSLRKGLTTCISPYQKELPRKRLKPVQQRTEKCFIKELKNKLPIVTKPKTPNYACKHSGWTSRESPSCSKVKSCLPFSENRLSSVPETSHTWSPELFSQKVT